MSAWCKQFLDQRLWSPGKTLLMHKLGRLFQNRTSSSQAIFHRILIEYGLIDQAGLEIGLRSIVFICADI